MGSRSGRFGAETKVMVRRREELVRHPQGETLCERILRAKRSLECSGPVISRIEDVATPKNAVDSPETNSSTNTKRPRHRNFANNIGQHRHLIMVQVFGSRIEGNVQE